MSKVPKIFKSSVATFSSLPTSGNAEGDVRTTRDTGFQYYWSIVSGSGSLADWRVINDPMPSPITEKQKQFHELLNEYKMALETFYEEYTYTGNKLTGRTVWTDNSKTIQLYGRTFSYTGNKLTSDTITRISDGAISTRIYSYTGNKLTSREFS